MCTPWFDFTVLDPLVLAWSTGLVGAVCAGVRVRSGHAWVTAEPVQQPPAHDALGYRGFDGQQAPPMRMRSHAVRGEERKLAVYLGLMAALLLALVVTRLSDAPFEGLGSLSLVALGLVGACSLVSALALIAASPLYLRLLPWTRRALSAVALLGCLAGLSVATLVTFIAPLVGVTALAFMALLIWVCIANTKRLRSCEHALRETLAARRRGCARAEASC